MAYASAWKTVVYLEISLLAVEMTSEYLAAKWVSGKRRISLVLLNVALSLGQWLMITYDVPRRSSQRLCYQLTFSTMFSTCYTWYLICIYVRSTFSLNKIWFHLELHWFLPV
jgi:hypothetical protein